MVFIGLSCGGPKAHSDFIYNAVDILLLVLLDQQKFYEKSDKTRVGPMVL